MADGLKKIAIVFFSFTLRKEEPGPCNVRIAKIVEEIYTELTEEGFDVSLAGQWEVALQLVKDGYTVKHIVQPRKTLYLDTDAVWKEVEEKLLRPEDINDVVPVAHRWLQTIKVKQLIKSDGFRIIKRMKLLRDKIGFDKSPLNLQSWTKGPLRAFKHAIRKQFFGHNDPTVRDIPNPDSIKRRGK
jgi:hypothetical protein